MSRPSACRGPVRGTSTRSHSKSVPSARTLTCVVDLLSLSTPTPRSTLLVSIKLGERPLLHRVAPFLHLVLAAVFRLLCALMSAPCTTARLCRVTSFCLIAMRLPTNDRRRLWRCLATDRIWCSSFRTVKSPSCAPSLSACQTSPATTSCSRSPTLPAPHIDCDSIERVGCRRCRCSTFPLSTALSPTSVVSIVCD